MISIRRTDSEDPDFITLVRQLDADLAKRDGDDTNFYSQFNKIASIKHALVAYANGQPIGCGAIKAFSTEAMEVKRMYTLPEARGKGVATLILSNLETWAAELGYVYTVLETGKRQPEAIELYLKNGYDRTENYGQYIGIENSLCFRKSL